jgi:hypothetical protein
VTSHANTEFKDNEGEEQDFYGVRSKFPVTSAFTAASHSHRWGWMDKYNIHDYK